MNRPLHEMLIDPTKFRELIDESIDESVFGQPPDMILSDVEEECGCALIFIIIR